MPAKKICQIDPYLDNVVKIKKQNFSLIKEGNYLGDICS